MNVETCGHVADLIMMAHAFAEPETASWHASTKMVSNVGTISLKPFTPHSTLHSAVCTYAKKEYQYGFSD